MFKKMKQGLSQLSQKSTWLPSIVIVLVAVLLLLPQLTSRGVIAGSDFLFHYNRFYETAMQIKTGNFSYFMSLYGFYSSGRIVNALYGPYFAYFQGILVLINLSAFVTFLVECDCRLFDVSFESQSFCQIENSPWSSSLLHDDLLGSILDV